MNRLPSFLRPLAFAIGMSLGLSLTGCMFALRDVIDAATSSDPYPYSWYERRELRDGTWLRFGQWGEKGEHRMTIERSTTDQINVGNDNLVWRRTYGRLGEGGHVAFTSGAVLPDGTIVAAAGAQTLTTLGLFAFAPDGRVLWAHEHDLPEKIASRARLFPAGDGAVVLAPLSQRDNHQPTSMFVLRLGAHGEILWATTLTLAGEPMEALWSSAGLTVYGQGIGRNGGLLWRVSPTGDLVWMEEIDAPSPRHFQYVKTSVEASGGVLLHVRSSGCPVCGFSDTLDLRLDPTGALQSVEGKHGTAADEPGDPHRPRPPRDPKSPEVTAATLQIQGLQPSVAHPPMTASRDLRPEMARTEKVEQKAK